MDPVTLQLLLMLAFGLILLFFGYPLFRLLLVVAGAAVGFNFGPALVSAVTNRPPEPWVALAAALVAAVILGLLAWFAFRVLVFLWGLSFGYGVSFAAGLDPWLAVVVGLAIGLLALFFQRVLIVALTAISGAGLVVYVAMIFLGAVPARGLDPLVAQPWLGLVILVLAVLGASAQFRRAEGAFRI